MYQVIARKYRPQTFDDVVNQTHVKQTLVNAIEQQRVGHGYIFSGLRGSGKTTMARLVAKALNCEKGPTANPCLECSSCREVSAGNSMDVIEIDAASNRRIDDIRELREIVRYQPARDRYKVLIIDEAHQITNDAFNALLKTLEEPPEWVVFILCTTEPQDIPATIVSRCQTFQYRSVDLDEVVGRLQWICEQEGVEAEVDALNTIALAGDGSIRDSLSTLDQAIACFGKKLETAEVRKLLGAIPAEVTENIVDALQAQDGAALLEVVDGLVREGRQLQQFCGELTRYFRNLMVLQLAGAETRLVNAGADERKRMAAVAGRFSQEDLTRYLQLLLALYRDLQHASQPRFRLEVGLLKLVYAGHVTPIEELLSGGGAGSSTPLPQGTPPARTNSGPSDASARAPIAAPAIEEPPPPIEEHSAPPPAPEPAAPEPAAPAPPDQPDPTRSPAATGDDPKSLLSQTLRDTGDSMLADAIAASRVVVNGSSTELRPAPDYEPLIELQIDDIRSAAKKALPGAPVVQLGPPLSQAEATPVSASSSVGATASATDAVLERARQHPALQAVEKLFPGGRFSGARDLKEYM